jgi:histone deacetylase complex regulatory component SIN3
MPGVIHRIALLFRGHDSLIKGFRAFLSPGYQFECSGSGEDTELVITTPSGDAIRHPLPMSIDISTEQRIADSSGPVPAPPIPADVSNPPVEERLATSVTSTTQEASDEALSYIEPV